MLNKILPKFQKILGIVGHTISEQYMYTNNFIQIVNVEFCRRILENLSEEEKLTFEKEIESNPNADIVQMTITLLSKFYKPEQIQKIYDDSAEYLFSDYIKTIVRECTPEQRAQIESVVQE